MSDAPTARPLGFWSCWALVVGTMIGSGVFLLPATLAPYGLLGFGGWLVSGAGIIALGLVFGRLASRTSRNGGPYLYVRDVFGERAGFMMAWGYWVAYWSSTAVVAIAFAGYLSVFVPMLRANSAAQATAGVGIIAVLTAVNIRGLKEMSAVQIVMTLLKIAPLLAIVGLGLTLGTPANLPAFNPTGASIPSTLAAVTLITLWPFTGFEAVTTSAGSVRDAERTLPRALIAGIVVVTIIYLSATLAVMLLVPADALAHSNAPFADAARGFGSWGEYLVAAGALVATAGALNGIIFTTGQMPMAVALDGRAPRWLGTLNRGGTPARALLLSSTLGSLLLLANYSRGLIGAFTFLLMMSTSIALIYYFFCGLAELRHSWRSARGWAAIAIAGCAYSLFALLGSGWEVFFWGAALMLVGVPVSYLLRPRGVAAPTSAGSSA